MRQEYRHKEVSDALLESKVSVYQEYGVVEGSFDGAYAVRSLWRRPIQSATGQRSAQLSFEFCIASIKGSL